MEQILFYSPLYKKGKVIKMKKKRIVVIGLIASLMLNTFYASAVNDEAFDDASFRESELSEEVMSGGNNIPAEDVSAI